MFNEKETEKILNKLEKELLTKTKRQKPLLTNDWTKNISANPGVYAIFGGNKIIYVGESGNVQKRMRDLRDTRNHQIRRYIGDHRFSKTPGYKPASCRIKFPSEIERKIDKFIEEKCTIAVLSLFLGRKELEEYICEKYKLVLKFNRRGKRKGCKK